MSKPVEQEEIFEKPKLIVTDSNSTQVNFYQGEIEDLKSRLIGSQVQTDLAKAKYELS